MDAFQVIGCSHKDFTGASIVMSKNISLICWSGGIVRPKRRGKKIQKAK